MPLTAPENEVAPIWLATAPICTEVMTPSGIATRIVGSSETRVMNQACSMNSSQENRRWTMSEAIAWIDSTPRTTSSPLVITPLRARSRRWSSCVRPGMAMLLNSASQKSDAACTLPNVGPGPELRRSHFDCSGTVPVILSSIKHLPSGQRGIGQPHHRVEAQCLENLAAHLELTGDHSPDRVQVSEDQAEELVALEDEGGVHRFVDVSVGR